MLSEDKQKELAVALYKHFCIENMADDWGWYNEWNDKNTWACRTHKEWLNKAQHVAKGSNNNIEQIMEALNIVNEVKKLLKK